MRQRQLGNDGPMLSVLGLGGWKFGGSWLYGLGEADDASSIATIKRALDHGVNWIDTAPIYGKGRSEEVIGRALVGLDDVFVNTKCGHHLAPDGTTTFVDNSPDVIKRECEARDSRTRSGVAQVQEHDSAGSRGFACAPKRLAMLSDTLVTCSHEISRGWVNGGVSYIDHCDAASSEDRGG